MLSLETIHSWIIKLHNQLTLYHAFILILQLYVASVVAISSPFVLRHLFLPSLAEYSAPLYFNFETCRDQLAGVCSFPTAVVDFSADNLELSPGIYYEVSAEIILSETAPNSNVGMFQAILESVDELNNKRTFRRSCFASKNRGIIYRIYELWWNLTCKTIFFPMYFFGLLSVANNRKIDVSFTDRLVDRDIAKTVVFYVQLQNRFIEVESGELFLRARFGLLRIFLHDYPIISSLLIAGFTYFTCLAGIALYWMLQILVGYYRLTNSRNNTMVVNESEISHVQREDSNKSGIGNGLTFRWASRKLFGSTNDEK